MAENTGPIVKVKVGDEEMMLVPSSVSDERVQRLGLPEAGSEDVSLLLALPPRLPQAAATEHRDYRPENAVVWVVDVEFEGDPVLEATALSEAFDREWLDSNGRPTIYGWSPEIGHWTYLVSADAPKTFTKLAFGWQLSKSYDEDFEITSTDLERYLIETKKNLKRFGSPQVKTNRSPIEATELSAQIKRTVIECDRDVVIVLKAPVDNPFDGKLVWDVMMCLGLRWGDGDLFHLHNESNFGDDMFFSVETTSTPGYFLPEHIAAGHTRYNDLVFAYSIPRSANPELVLKSMIDAATYTKKRLGGKLQDRNGFPLNQNQLKIEVKSTLQKLKEAGLNPGEEATLLVF